ncbi:MAG: toxin-antitoxin system YwqK family antitoxin [Geovibrio sp.]|nr:toxin-antitoxin system YwqK family antitoxin [Geovibrio sp.]
MRLIAVFFTFFLIALSSYADVKCDGKSVIKRNGLIMYENGEVASGQCTASKSNGEYTEFELQNGMIEGWFRIYNSDKTRLYEAQFINNSPNGKIASFYNNGTLKLEGNYAHGKVDGYTKAYYPNGKTEYEVMYKNNREIGLATKYYDNGNIEYELNFDDGIVNGMRREYHRDGSLMSEVMFVNGLADGKRKIYFPDGALGHDVFYIKGKVDGVVKSYFNNGQQAFEIIYNNSEPVSGVCFDKTRKVRLTQEELKDWQNVKCWDSEMVTFELRHEMPLVRLEFR